MKVMGFYRGLNINNTCYVYKSLVVKIDTIFLNEIFSLVALGLKYSACKISWIDWELTEKFIRFRKIWTWNSSGHVQYLTQQNVLCNSYSIWNVDPKLIHISCIFKRNYFFYHSIAQCWCNTCCELGHCHVITKYNNVALYIIRLTQF